jgi:hypothetical protein
MAWVTLTESDILRKVSSPELAALRTKVLADGQADPLAEEIAACVRQVRAKVKVRNVPASDESLIPDELLTAAADITTWRLIGRLPVKSLATDERKLAYTDGLAALDDAADGKMVITPPEEASGAETGGSGVDLAKSTATVAQPCNLSGLF